MKVLSLPMLMLIGLAGCASTDSYSAIQDRSTGRVLISYEVEASERHSLSPEHANHVATQRCKMLGYSFTERAVGVMQHCSATDNAGDCSLWQVERTYQCAGNAISTPPIQSGSVAYSTPPRVSSQP